MAVPKQRHTKSRRNKRRMHIYLKKHLFGKCPKCRKTVLPHTVCQQCGFYKNIEVIDVFKKLTKKERKEREKEIQAGEREQVREKTLSMEELSRR
jgi:large subunit ribosomal protein L32